MASVSIQDCILSLSFKKNTFVSAIGGSIIFGPVKLHNGVYYYSEKEQFSLHHRKFPEFLSALKQLATNLVTATDENVARLECTLEIAPEETIKIHQNKIIKVLKDQEECDLRFDQFIFCDFMVALSEVAIFVTNPTPLQYSFVCKYQEKKGHSLEDILRLVKNISPEESISESVKLLLLRYLTFHSHILDFISETNKMSGF